MAKRLSATPLSKETRIDTSEPSRGAILVPVARIGSPLLLKTNLPRSPGATQAATGRIYFSIAGRNVPGNDSTSKLLRDLSCCAVCRFGFTPFSHLDEHRLHRSPEAIAAAHWAEKQ